MAVPFSDEGLGLEVDTSDEEPEEPLNDEILEEDSTSSNDSENEPISPILSKSARPPSLLQLRENSYGAEGSITGNPGR
jgi:hypothetical protein